MQECFNPKKIQECPPTTNSALQCVPFSLNLRILQCFLCPHQEAVMCFSVLVCYDTILRLRMMPCILRHANVTAQAILVKQVDQHPPPQPEDAAHAIDEEAVHHTPPPVVLLLPQEAN